MIVNFIHNTILEVVILVFLLLWVIGGATILLPLYTYLVGLDYWCVKDIIECIRDNKITKE